MKIKTIMILIILIFSFQSGLDIQAQSGDNLQFTDSIITPRVDGIKDIKYSSDVVPEWADAIVHDLGDSLQRDSIEGRIFQKSVGNQLFLALDIPSNILTTLVQFDIDGSNSISMYDIRIEITPSPRSFGNSLDIEINDGRSWVALNEFDTFSRSALIIDEVLPSIVSVATSNKDSEHAQWIEIQFNLEKYEKTLQQLDDNFDISTFSVNNLFSFGVINIDENGGSYGFPSNPINIDGKIVLEEFEPNEMGQYAPEVYQTDIGIDNVIVTQAIQNQQSSLSLVKGKTTMVRVIVDHDEQNSIPVEVSLHGYLLGGDLLFEIGSHTTQFLAPKDPNVNVLSHTVNFILPTSWVENSNVQLKVTVDRQGFIDTNYEDNTHIINAQFGETYDMTVYYMKINTGTDNFPELPSNFKVSEILTGFEESFPMANPKFIELDWQTVGEFSGTDDELIVELDNVYFDIIESIANQISEQGFSNIPIPDQIAGIRVGTSGISTPLWGDNPKNGLAVVLGEENPLVLAHEINHNLGDNDWGRHVSDENYGCDAPGPDQAWNEQYTDDDIHELGWSPSWGLFSENYADFMSYCFSSYPGTWISDYRWENLFTLLSVNESPFPQLLPTALTFGLNAIAMDDLQSTSRFIGGQYNSDGTFNLEPSFELPGNLQSNLPQLDDETHQIVIQYVDGSTTSIDLNLTSGSNPETHSNSTGNDVIFGGFGYWVPDNGLITGFSILGKATGTTTHNTTTGNDLRKDITIEFTTPSTIQRNSASEISWSGGIDNRTTVYTQFQYSSDNSTWMDVGSVTTDNKVIFQPGLYPGSSQGLFRVLISNGFDTIMYHSSNTSIIEGLDPKTSIKDNLKVGINNTIYKAVIGSFFSLSGTGYDAEDLDNLEFNWAIHFKNGTLYSTYNGSNIDFVINEIGLFDIVFSVTDSDGNSDNSTIEVEIIPPIQVELSQFDNFNPPSQNSGSQSSSQSPEVSLPLNYFWVLLGLLSLQLKRSINVKFKLLASK